MIFSRRTLTLGLLSATALSVSGCGFRMRGRFSLPFETLYLESPDNTPFTALLSRQLRAGSNITLVKNIDQADAVLHILSRNRTATELSYDANGDVRSYELHLAVNFSLTTPKGGEYLAPDTVTIIREINYNDSTEYLSRDREQEMVYKEMERDAISQMLRRIERAQANPVEPEDLRQESR